MPSVANPSFNPLKEAAMAPSPEPFQLSIPETALADLKTRLAMARFPDRARDDRWACGTDIEYLRSLLAYCKRWRCCLPALCRSVALGAAFLGGIAIGANADPLCRAGVDACQPPADRAPQPPHGATLPNVDIFEGQLNLHPYSSPGVGPRVSSFRTVRAEHYEVPAGFDTNVPSHPYTSGVGPWPGPGTAGTSMAGSKPPSHHYRKSSSLTTPSPSSGTP
jgi:hypothetical protein